MKIRPLSQRREAMIRRGLAPGNFWIGFPTDYARQLLNELDKARAELEQLKTECEAELDRGTLRERGGIG